MSPHKLKSMDWIKKYSDFTFMSAELYSWTADFTLQIDKPMKTTPKWVLKSWNLCTVSKNSDFNFMSADLYSWTADFTLPIDGQWKNIPK